MCFAAMALAGVTVIFHAHSNEDGEPYGFSTASLYGELTLIPAGYLGRPFLGDSRPGCGAFRPGSGTARSHRNSLKRGEPEKIGLISNVADYRIYGLSVHSSLAMTT